MHQIIRVIVYAKDEEEALDNAKGVFERLCGDDKPFDYYTTFDDDKSTVSGKSRWGNLPVVALAESNESKKLIDDGFKYTKDSFMKNIKEIRKCINNFTDEELFEEQILNDKTKVVERLNGENNLSLLTSFKYKCYCVGQYSGSNIFLYNNDGEGIRDTEHLKDVLTKWESLYQHKEIINKYNDLKVFVVPADVHS